MKLFLFLSDFLIPFSMFYIIIYGFFQGTDVYESFLQGVREGFRIVAGIAPTMVALLVSVGVFRACGALDFLCGILGPAGNLLNIPLEMIPVFMVRMFSSSAAIGFVLDIFKEYGPDSRPGLMASVMMSCTETVIYTITIYFMSVGIRKTRWTLPGALAATLAGTVASILITDLMPGAL